jgi:hypothetical protein
MDIRKIEQLLEKFFDGTSSSEEEQQLREFFQQDNLPDHLISLRSQFCFPAGYVARNETNQAFKDTLEHAIRQEEKSYLKNKSRRILLTIASTAAVLLLMIGILFAPKPSKLEDTFNNPAQAYEEASKALLYVSGQLNKGLKPLQESSEKFNIGINKTSEINRLEVIKNFIKTE